mgnify:CR=1 FL=1
MIYSFPAEKFSIARRALMLPHPDGQHASLETALTECRLGLHRMNRAKLPDDIRTGIHQLECFMDTTGFVDADGEGAWVHMLRSRSADDRAEVARLIDMLAQWFASQEP